MGTMTFQLPSGLAADAARELERTFMAGGPDNMPWPTELHFSGDRLTVHRPLVEESGYLVAPWTIHGLGLLMGTSATLIERTRPYHLLTELARGKVNQVRSQASDWRSGGLALDAELEDRLHQATTAFGRALTGPDEEQDANAQAALDHAYEAAGHLVHAYSQQVFQIRHQRQARLDSILACRLGTAVPAEPLAEPIKTAFNTVGLPLSWGSIETEQGAYRWEDADALVGWAERQGLAVTAGPLVDFSSAQLPAWLWLWERDLPSLATFMCRFVETAVRHFRGKIRRWQVTAASNCANCLSLTEDNLLQLTWRLAEAARQAVPDIELVVGIAQPWGEYKAQAERNHSPFIFADTLIRSGLNLAALDLEVIMGVEPRGSYCRDLLEVSRLLDLYALLGVSLQVTLGYPSGGQPDLEADPEIRVGGGAWTPGRRDPPPSSAAARDTFSGATQADWAASFAALSLCKPYVQGVQWAHLSDAEPHQFPHCGLVERSGSPKPALERLRELRKEHLR
jgi:hypothetical protein